MKSRISGTISGVLASSTVLLSVACSGRSTALNDVDGQSAGQEVNPAAGGVNEPPNPGDCECAISDSLMPLSCSGLELPNVDNHIVQATTDGNVVAFTLCEENLGRCRALRWAADSGTTTLLSDSMSVGLNAEGDRVLAATGNGLVLIDVNGGHTEIPIDLVDGRGMLNAAGDTVIGSVHDDESTHLVSVNASTGEMIRLGSFAFPTIINAEVTPDADAIAGYAFADPFVWQAQGQAIDMYDALGSVNAAPEAISSDGAVIAGQANGKHFRWSQADGYTEVSGSSRSETALSADGNVVVGSLDPPGGSDTSAFRWTASTGAVELSPGTPSTATDVSDDGSVVIATSWEEEQFDTERPQATFVWDAEHGTRTLDAILSQRGVDTSGWDFGYARELSGNGKVLFGRAHCGGVPTFYRVILSD